jgi:hypothetical protein
MALLEESHSSGPADSKVITSGKMRPSAISVPKVHHMFPTSHIWSAAAQVRASATLAEVEGVHPEQTMAIGRSEDWSPPAGRTDDIPSTSSVATPIPEEHASSTTTFKHFESHQMPSGTATPRSLSIAPTMQAIVVDCVSIVNP